MTTAAQMLHRPTVPLASQIERLVDGVHGWSPLDQLLTLATLVYATSHLDGDVVEIGSWCGRSAIAMATALRGAGGGVVHAVDLFPRREDWCRNTDGSYSFSTRIGGREFRGYEQQTVWAEPFERQMAPVYDAQPDVFAVFRQNIGAAGCADLVRPHRGTSETFARAVPSGFGCRLLFLDGDHSYDAVREDLANMEPLLVPGAWVCFDDAFSTYEGVNRAITECVIDNPAYDLTQQMTRKCFAARRAPATRSR